VFDAAMTVSQDSADYLRFAFPGLDVSIVEYPIDPAVFYPAEEPPSKRLAMMPRKRQDDARQIVRLLGERLHGWDVVEIEGVSESDAAAMLRSAPIFLALGWREGFGLPVAEAMASGCFVVGFPAFGGRDLFDPDFSLPVEDGDVLSAARGIAEAMSRYECEPEVVRDAGARASRQIRERYSLERQAGQLTAFYEQLL
jgi:glycosyltransferase involved in cell wall biosynthesis